MNSIRNTMLEAGVLERGCFTFRSGVRANNHFSAERLLADRELKSRVTGYLAIMANGLEPDALVSIPSGADPWAEAVAMRLKKPVPVIYLNKIGDEDRGWGFDFASEDSRRLAECSDS